MAAPIRPPAPSSAALRPSAPAAPFGLSLLRSWWRQPHHRKQVATGAALACLFTGGLGYGSWTRVCAAERCPSISRIIGSQGPQQTSKVFAADGRLITELGIERRTVVPLAEMPLHVRQAFIAVEDKRFYSHHGIDYLRVLGALKADILSLSWAEGFSTITMQLARNVFPDQISREKTPTRKLKEARVAVELERNFPKDTILELYLNQIGLGPNIFGVEAAAQVFFGKSARDLNVAEAATLAALPKAPGTYNPRTHPDRAVARRNIVLGLMREQGFLTPEDAEQWKAYPLVLTSRRTSYGDVAPYFVEWLRTDFLGPRFGRDLYEKGLRIYTTLDLDMQEAAERALQSQLDEIEAGVYSNGKFEGRSTYREYIERGRASGEDQGPFSPYLQGALVALDAKTGNILAMVGGRDFVDSKWNRATQSVRPPGSTFKPFVYSAAVRAGWPVDTMLDDSPLNPPVIQLDSSLWQPKDYDDTTLGAIPMRMSLYLSRNLSTIKLGMALGEQTVIGEVRRYGITTALPPYPSIHIGAKGVKPLEIIAAYTAFANLGTRVVPIGIQRIEDRQGTILYQSTVQKEPVMDPEHSWLMLDMLRDVMRCQPGTGVNRCGTAAGAVAGLRVPMGGKTGTTDDYTDAWFVGFTPEIVAGIWIGYDLQQRIMANAGGGRIVAPAWTKFMRDVYERRPAPPDWGRPDSLITREVDWSNGYLATPFCPLEVRRWEWFYPGTEPTQVCPVHPPFGVGITP
ncbi:MAG TPA: PBP1A family penicillin-binding protein [Gemmatimonadales bacterium]|jgi:penicillin-binding protein 1A|nr:PBP1A family penicillin-binding protein [Gemmatimonadales bacterium]